MTPMLILERVREDVTETAALIDGVLMEYRISRGGAESLAGEILLGRVERVLGDVSAAFVNVGRKRNGFLPLHESDSFESMHPAPLLSGQSVVVQVQKDEKGDKGVFLTRDLSLPGMYVIVMPMNRYIGVSKRVSGEGERSRLIRLGRSIAGHRCGLIMRQAALFAREEEIRSETDALLEQWEKACLGAENQKPPRVLMPRERDALSMARDYAPRHEVQMLDFSQEERVWESWRKYRVDVQLGEARARKVVLPTGETLVIDEREALQTIDVNSAHNTDGEEGSLAFTVNSHVVREAARQIRLRNLSGIILIDFTDMEKESERQAIQAAMEEALSDDRTKHVIHGFTRLGILEMTRKRSGPSLSEMLADIPNKGGKSS